MKIRCIAVDDEPLALGKVKGYIGKIDFLELVESFNNGIDAMNYIRQHPVDLIFLDIQMEELTGIQMLETMTVKPKVILTTAYDSYALKGYELDVTDYLLKPISFQRFLQAAEKVFSLISSEQINTGTSGKQQPDNNLLEHFFVKSGNAMVKIDLNDVYFIEGMKDYLRIWTSSEKIMTLMSFRNIEDKLPANEFIRIHKSYLVSVSKIESIERNRVRIAGELLPVGDSYRRQFNQQIEKRKIDR